MVGWLVGRLVGWLVGRLVSWSVGWLDGWSVGRLVGWLVVRSVITPFLKVEGGYTSKVSFGVAPIRAPNSARLHSIFRFFSSFYFRSENRELREAENCVS